MLSPHRILICDDEERIRKSLGGLLRDNGYEVIVAESSSQCLEIAAAQDFDLVILDIIMPDMDGIEVLDRIKKMGKDTEAIMITPYSFVVNTVGIKWPSWRSTTATGKTTASRMSLRCFGETRAKFLGKNV